MVLQCFFFLLFFLGVGIFEVVRCFVFELFLKKILFDCCVRVLQRFFFFEVLESFPSVF